MSKPPIFVVGVQRSGTTLLAALLAAHGRMSCGPETHFFRWLAQEDKPTQLCSEESWPGRAQAFIGGISATTYSPPGRVRLVERYSVDEADIGRYLQEQQPSIATLLGSITVPYMERMGKQRWVEKTPDHIQFVELIREHFPNSPIVRIVRDPRDVALSLRKVPWGAQTLTEGLLFWKRLHESSADFLKHDRLSYTLRFEDLLAAPQETLKALCAFIGEEYEEQMLDTSRTGQAVNSRRVAWKEKASQPVDGSRIAIWRHSLSAEENTLSEALVGNYLDEYRYPRLADFPHLAEVYPEPLPTNRFEAELTELAGEGIRFWRTTPDERPAARIYIGDPGNRRWLGETRVGRSLKLAAISKNVLQARVSHKRLFWITELPTGTSDRLPGAVQSKRPKSLLQRLLSPYRVGHTA